MRKLIPCMILVFCLYQPSPAHAASSYIRDGSIGKQKGQTSKSKKDPFGFRPVTSWVGERFIFLPRGQRMVGGLPDLTYNHFREKETGNRPKGEEAYKRYVGGTARVVAVKEMGKTSLPFPSYIDALAWEVEFEMEDDGTKLITTAYEDDLLFVYPYTHEASVRGIGPVSDIDNARAKWLEKVLWWSTKDWLQTYDAETDKVGFIGVKPYSPVKVIDIVAGLWGYRPVRFIVRTASGEEGFIDINFTGTNVSNFAAREKYRFHDVFLAKDPRKTHRWSARVWSAIEKGKVFIGMTADQARMSWGEPSEVNRTIVRSHVHEQWVYGSIDASYLYFENGKLVGIQH